MRLSDFGLAATLVAEHARIARSFELAAAGKIGITINGNYQSDDIVAAAQDAVAAAFTAQLAEIEASLAAIGVTVGPIAQ